jgi:hypothetical protein
MGRSTIAMMLLFADGLRDSAVETTDRTTARHHATESLNR